MAGNEFRSPRRLSTARKNSLGFQDERGDRGAVRRENAAELLSEFAIHPSPIGIWKQELNQGSPSEAPRS